MATTVYTQEVIELQDGVSVTLRPLPIGRLRRFMKAYEDFVGLENDSDAGFDIFVNLSGIALENEFKGKFEKTADVDKIISDEYREYLEEVLDMDTIYKIIEVAGGMKLNDPNLIAAATEAAAAAGMN